MLGHIHSRPGPHIIGETIINMMAKQHHRITFSFLVRDYIHNAKKIQFSHFNNLVKISHQISSAISLTKLKFSLLVPL